MKLARSRVRTGQQGWWAGRVAGQDGWAGVIGDGSGGAVRDGESVDGPAGGGVAAGGVGVEVLGRSTGDLDAGEGDVAQGAAVVAEHADIAGGSGPGVLDGQVGHRDIA